MIEFLKKIGLIEITLFQIIVYGWCWLTNEYLATLLSAIFIPIFGGILIIALIAELLDRSKVPKAFFHFLIISFLIPIIMAIVVYLFFDGTFESWDLQLK